MGFLAKLGTIEQSERYPHFAEKLRSKVYRSRHITYDTQKFKIGIN